MKIAIAGYGVEGQENFTYWSNSPENEVTIADENGTGAPIPEGVPTIIGADAFQRLQDFDLVIRTAGLAPRKITTNGKIWSATNEFFEKCPAPIIGITGSKGKGTTSSLIASILEAAGKKVWLVGNIGISSLSVLSQVQPDDVVVYELSSFQLWDLEKSPHIAVVLLIEPDHLDVHASMEEYVEAKAQITRHQTTEDILIFNAQNNYSTQIAESSQATKVGFPSEGTTHVVDGWFYNGEQKLCPVEALKLPGAHNIDNATAAIDAVWSFTQDPGAIEKGLSNFKGLPHRLAFVRNVKDVEYYDDSIATTPGSAIAGLRAFPDKSKVIILGGSYKGSDFSQLAIELTKHDARAILIGDEALRIAEAFQVTGFKNYEILEDATAELFTKRAAELAQPGGVVLLSPAAASFGLFKNYADRGEQFIAAVNSL
ncbi:MAG: UDP-N-acetylmuramoyl-L-alanine--D-glutamate ligase [Patescibacteria group bacterium]